MRREDEDEALHGPRLAGDDEGGAEGAFAPQLRFDEDGNMVVDESSLSVTAGRATRLQHTGQVEDAERLGVTSSSYLSRAPSTSWSVADTAAFYEALRVHGTDFTLIASLFPHRERRQIKNKFKREASISLHLPISPHISPYLPHISLPSSWTRRRFARPERDQPEVITRDCPR